MKKGTLIKLPTKSVYLIFSLLGSFLLTSCATTYTQALPDKSVILDSRREIQLDAVRQRAPITMQDARRKGAEIRRQIRPFAIELCQHLGERRLKDCTNWDARVVDSDELNATTDGKNINLYRGLFEFTRSDDEIAFIFAHEVSHIMLNHHREDSVSGTVGSMIGNIVGAALVVGLAAATGVECTPGTDDCDWVVNLAADIGETGGEVGREIANLRYSKDQENEADLMGAYILSLSGFSLIRARELLVQMGRMEEKPRLISKFSDSHPVGAERLARFSNIIDEVQTNISRMPQK